MLRSLKKTLVLAIIFVFSFIVFAQPALALVPFEGQFIATDTCEALASIRKGTNPDNVRLNQGQTYRVVGKNKDIPTHYLVEIADTNPPQRWVATSCMSLADSSSEPVVDKPPIIPVATGKDYLLALSWQPAFCESKPEKPECKRLAANPNLPEAKNFVLHGLWPQPKSNIYCGVSQSIIALDDGKKRDWSKLPAIEKELSPETWEKLKAVMPGTLSNLHRHEWIKHGTCYDGTPEEYYAESIVLLEEFKQSPTQVLVANNIGRQLAIKDIDQALLSFGSASGEKVEVKCKDSLLGEFWINLAGDITLQSQIASLLPNSPNAKLEEFKSCLVDDARD
jgi:ribonuclease T2